MKSEKQETMDRLNLSQIFLAERADVSFSSVARWLWGMKMKHTTEQKILKAIRDWENEMLEKRKKLTKR